MKNYNIDLLFPKPIYRVHTLFDEELIDLEKSIKEIINQDNSVRDGRNNIDSTFQTNSRLHLNKNFVNLSNFILEHAKNFFKELSYNQHVVENCKFHKMWANISYGGDYIFPHIHGDCLIAGVFYVKAPSNSLITFFDDIDKIRISCDTYGSLNYEDYSYSCDPGTLLLFKNDMIHGNKKQPDGEKIAISFNIGV